MNPKLIGGIIRANMVKITSGSQRKCTLLMERVSGGL